MVFCCQNCSDLTWEKKCSSDREKLLKFKSEGREFEKKNEIRRIIHSNSESSEQFLKQNALLNCSWRVFLWSNTLEQFKFKLEKIVGIPEPKGKVWKFSCSCSFLHSMICSNWHFNVLDLIWTSCNKLKKYSVSKAFWSFTVRINCSSNI